MKPDNSKENFGLAEPYESFGQLLLSVRKRAGKSAKEMASLTGVHPNSQGYYEKTSRDPHVDYLIAYSCRLKVPFWQLLMRRVELGNASLEDKHTVLREVGPMTQYMAKHQSGSPINEGNSALYGEQEPVSPATKVLLACAKFIEQHQENQHIAVFEHDGSSMSPTINDGDTMIVDTSQRNFSEGDIFVIKYGETYSAKRIQFMPGGGVMLITDNTQYRSITLDLAEIDNLAVQGKLISAICNY